MSNLSFDAMEQAQPNFTNNYFRDLSSYYAGAGNDHDRGLLVAILILTCITLAVVLSAAAAYLYCNRLALVDRILGPRAPTPQWLLLLPTKCSPAGLPV